MKVCLYPGMQLFDNTFDRTSLPVLFETDKELTMGNLLKNGSIFYTVRSLNKEFAFVKPIVVIDNQIETCFERNVTCPYCSGEDRDSWELYDSDDEYECKHCGAILSYEREVLVEYSATLVKKPEIIEV